MSTKVYCDFCHCEIIRPEDARGLGTMKVVKDKRTNQMVQSQTKKDACRFCFEEIENAIEMVRRKLDKTGQPGGNVIQ